MMLWMNPHRRTRGQLSAYIDRQLSPGEARAVEAHLASCKECRAEADGLLATVRALQMLPQAEPPRSFALTPGMASRPARPVPARPLAQAQTGLRLVAAGLAVALAVAFTADLSNVTHDGGASGQRQAQSVHLTMGGSPPTLAPAPGVAGPLEGGGVTGQGTAPTGGVQGSAGIGTGPLEPSDGQPAPSPSSSEPATGVSGGVGSAPVPGVEALPSPVATPSQEAAATLGGVSSQGDNAPEVTEVPKANPDPGVYGAEVSDASGAEADLAQPGEGTDTLRIVEAALVVALALAVGGSVFLALAARRR